MERWKVRLALLKNPGLVLPQFVVSVVVYIAVFQLFDASIIAWIVGGCAVWLFGTSRDFTIEVGDKEVGIRGFLTKKRIRGEELLGADVESRTGLLALRHGKVGRTPDRSLVVRRRGGRPLVLFRPPHHLNRLQASIQALLKRTDTSPGVST